MASTIYLKGYALCNPPLSQAHFLLEADSSENLLQLNKKVQAKTKLSRSEFTFYKALGINIWPKENLPERVNGWLDHNLEEALDPMYAGQIQTIWTDNDMEYDNMLHFIAVDENALADLQLIHALSDPALYARVLDIQEHASTLNGFEQFPPPSQGAASPQDVHTRANGIRAGRPATYHGPSNALFDRHLAILSDKLRNLEIVHPTTDMLDFANRLVDTCAKFYETENAREQPVFQLLNEHFPNARHQQSITNNRAKPEAFWFLALIWELKNEQGNGGNVVVRAAIDYAKILADNNLSGHIRDRSNCPCVLLTLAGTDLNISTAISTDAVYIDTLYLQHLRGSFDRETLVLSVARAMQALKETFKKLSNFYAAMEANPAQSPRDGSYLFPNPVHAGRHDENLLETLGLRFLHKLSRNEEMFGNSRKQREENMSYTVYVALSSGNCESVPAGQVVVKFAQRYNLDAHELLAGADLAPKLYYHCPVLGGYTMIVMERVQGSMAWAWDLRGLKMPPTVFQDVERAINLLHENNIVFGDLHLPNIMVKDSQAVSHGALIDFDWAAKEDEGRYPATLSTANEWAPGVERYGLMKKAHDLHMLEMLRNKFAPVV